MELISMFEKNGIIFVKDSEGRLYTLEPIQEQNISNNIELKNNAVKEIDPETLLITNIKKMLQELGISPLSNGYNILVQSLYLIIKDDTYRGNFSNNLYPTLAKMFNISSNSVPTSISVIISQWRINDNYIKLFGNKVVGSKVFILTLANYFFNKEQKRNTL